MSTSFCSDCSASWMWWQDKITDEPGGSWRCYKLHKWWIQYWHCHWMEMIMKMKICWKHLNWIASLGTINRSYRAMMCCFYAYYSKPRIQILSRMLYRSILYNKTVHFHFNSLLTVSCSLAVQTNCYFFFTRVLVLLYVFQWKRKIENFLYKEKKSIFHF